MRFDDEHFAHEVGPRLHSSLDESTPLFRIVDFYSFARVVIESYLYIPLASRFSDENEGIEGALTRQAFTSGPCAGMIGPHFKSKEDFLEHQRMQRNRSYVSCWTRERESVAMWALYSQDHCSVQMESTVGRLVKAAMRFARKNYNPLDILLGVEQQANIVLTVDLIPVTYLSLIELGRRIDRRRRAYDYLEAHGRIRSSSSEDTSIRDNERSREYRFSSFSLKDTSFSHEREVRLVVTAAPVTQDIKIVVDDSIAKDSDRASAASDAAFKNAQVFRARAVARDESVRRGIQIPDFFDLKVDSDFVIRATIDPRCPRHKREFIEGFMKFHNVTQGESRCFGHAARFFRVEPRSKLSAA